MKQTKLKPPPQCNRNMNVERIGLLKNRHFHVSNRTRVRFPTQSSFPTSNAGKTVVREPHMKKPSVPRQFTQLQSINST